MDNNLTVGSLVISIKGRDKDRIYLVSSIIDDNFVSLVDGNFKLLANPKKKRIKHITVSSEVILTIKEKLEKDKKVFDSEVFSAIKNSSLNKKTV